MYSKLIALMQRPFFGWKRPSIQLAELAARAHRGEISIEEMASANCSRKRLAPLAAVLSEILLDLKQQRAERAALDQEIRDRIANRTDALERRIGSLQLLAKRDALTGLGNRRALDAELPRVISNYYDSGVDTCMLMIDVDHFKILNDTLGHPAGDQLLKEIGQLIRSTLRGNDLAFRCGGDEFVVLLYGCNVHNGMIIADRLALLVKSLTKSLAVSHPAQLSIGVAAVSELQDPTAESLVETSDRRLYAKKAVRPRIRKSA